MLAADNIYTQGAVADLTGCYIVSKYILVYTTFVAAWDRFPPAAQRGD
jgi:hypothetical protein